MFAPGKPAIALKLVTWFEDRSDALYLSSITAAEIEAGISKAHRTGPRVGQMNCAPGSSACSVFMPIGCSHSI
jgi:hypothetical protein